MSAIVTLNNHAWVQTSKSLMGTKLKDANPGSCSECKREPNKVCCPKFVGEVTIDSVPNVAEVYIFYFFKVLSNPEQLLRLFGSSNFFRARSVDHLDFEMQLSMAMMLDKTTIDALILQSGVAKKPNLVALELIDTQRVCALHYQDWERYNMVVGLWECFAIVCLFEQNPIEIREHLQKSVSGFLAGDQPDKIFQRVVHICGLIGPLLDESFIDQLLQDNERFRHTFLLDQLMSQLFR